MLFIFDWDGTLSDSTATITKAMHFAAQDMNWARLEDKAIHNIIGLGLPEAILQLYPQATSEDMLRLRDFYATHFLRLDQEKSSELFPGVRETLAALRDRGHLLAIATGKSRKGLDRILGVLGMSDYFDGTRCADETASKPSPQMLEELLLQFGIAAQDAVMIGDTEYDMDMAKRIHMPRIAVSYGAHHVDRLRSFTPELCVDQISEILTWHRLE